MYSGFLLKKILFLLEQEGGKTFTFDLHLAGSMTETLQKDPHSKKHTMWGRFGFRGPMGTITDTVLVIHWNAPTNTLLLFLLLYESCRPEEALQTPITSPTQAPKSHVTNPASQLLTVKWDKINICQVTFCMVCSFTLLQILYRMF